MQNRTDLRDIEALDRSQLGFVIHHSPRSTRSTLPRLNSPTDKLAPAYSRQVPSRTAVNKTLAYVEKAGGWNYSIEAARSGSAHAYVYDNSPVTRAPEIAAAEQESKAAGRGLWGPPCFGRTDPAPRS